MVDTAHQPISTSSMGLLVFLIWCRALGKYNVALCNLWSIYKELNTEGGWSGGGILNAFGREMEAIKRTPLLAPLVAWVVTAIISDDRVYIICREDLSGWIDLWMVVYPWEMFCFRYALIEYIADYQSYIVQV